ncbi:NUDIX hydrolase [Actinomadura bangladeshensis]|uniref:NUDIX domain-containing protein n=1 Tax=Actinomadura bangladeshensis TaxID=453573 RepID=A0A4R4PDU9_9ACTN|nr:NUDIX domain-containing protein [Actinomadura bangladeshensis]TDC19467.1 NUDIX domain-containing protein [Actinomadura bangladeshensis]CNE08879.1 MutT/NUDIX family protein [Mycobacterium tuberculosis]
MEDLDVVAWVQVSDGRMLAVRSRGRDLLYLPGGKREPGEDDWSALSREVREELDLELDRPSFRELGVVRAPAHDQPAFTHVRMACFTASYRGAMTAAGEVDEFVYVGRGDRRLLAPAARAALDLAGEHGLLTS